MFWKSIAVALTPRAGIFDVRQYALLQCFPLHAAAVNCIAVNDVDGYLVTGSADGDIKVKKSGVSLVSLSFSFCLPTLTISECHKTVSSDSLK